ncbi:Rossmann-like and DUF2520 domain-containing protein [Flagellimonas sp.]|uniref:Rossmann-like and DUF2520 domain-containing protein n=1 Tax=Flagellimonas sp. TaxID=2058762 RepID=UPI003F49FA9B
MLSVVILGTGNVAENLIHALYHSKQAHLLQIVGRKQHALNKYTGKAKITSNFENIEDADIYIIAVSDSAIQMVAEKLLGKQGLVVHTSGATSMHSISSVNKGVFYPLQTFTKERILDFTNIPICVEASNNQGLELLHKLGTSISSQVHEISSEQREKLHLAAVFANNFSNHLFHISEMVCAKEGLSFELLKPLILETVQKLESLSPYKAQTGPARRKDIPSMEKHLELLPDEEHKKLYTLLSEAIMKTYEKEL